MLRPRPSRPAWDCSSRLGTLVVWYIGGRDVLFGRMTLGSLMAFLAYLAMFYTPLTTIAESTAWFANFVGTSRRIGDLLDTPSELAIARPGGERRCASHACGPGQVEFQDVSFGYDKSRPVLKDVTFTIAPARWSASWGEAGRASPRWSASSAGSTKPIRAKSSSTAVDVRQIDPQELRRQIGMVPQDFVSLPRIGRREHCLWQLAGRAGTNPRRCQAGRRP